jgi:hypothetical protein
MKLSAGSGKATLPGLLQVYRYEDRDLICPAEEPAPKDGGVPLLTTVWENDATWNNPAFAPAAVRREAVMKAVAAHGGTRRLVASDALVAKIEACQQG